MKNIVLIFVVVFFFSFKGYHPLKMTFSKMSISDNYVYLKTNFFADDLCAQIEKKYRLKQADFSTLHSNGTLVLQNYLKEHLVIYQNDKSITFDIENVFYSEKNSILTVETKSHNMIDSLTSFSLKNTIFQEVFSSQTNSVHFKTNNKRHTLSKKQIIYNE